ncbi:MAG: hydrogenase maturation nickel metallochaperone HypA [Spirochaetales bacterium]|nr:hydrogenase maturation nickel metallochaperone HypA [Spirochaetales bacterium]
MHELGILVEVVKTVEDFARKNNLEKIDTLVLQIGELSEIVPQYIKECYPAAVDGTMLDGTNLRVDILPGNGICQKCNKVFNIIEGKGKCTHCKSRKFEVISGHEFMIKEVIAC